MTGHYTHKSSNNDESMIARIFLHIEFHAQCADISGEPRAIKLHVVCDERRLLRMQWPHVAVDARKMVHEPQQMLATIQVAEVNLLVCAYLVSVVLGQFRFLAKLRFEQEVDVQKGIEIKANRVNDLAQILLFLRRVGFVFFVDVAALLFDEGVADSVDGKMRRLWKLN